MGSLTVTRKVSEKLIIDLRPLKLGLVEITQEPQQRWNIKADERVIVMRNELFEKRERGEVA